VVSRTKGEQRPEVSVSLFDSFTLKPGAPAASPQTPPANAEVVFWQSIENSTHKEDFQAYLEKFPDGMFIPLARTRLAALEPAAVSLTEPASPAGLLTPQAASPEIAFWQSIMNSTRKADFETYLARYPNGMFTAAARERIATFEVVTLEPATLPANPEVLFWQSILTSTSRADFEAYLAQYPNGRFVPLARTRLAALEPAASPSPAQATPPACDAGLVTSVGNAGVAAAAAERCLHAKDIFKDCSNCPEMVVIPAGSFIMGSPATEKDRGSNEGPQHKVTFHQVFAVGKFAVTFDEWNTCVSDGGCDGYMPSDSYWGHARRPVVNVSWNDAQSYLTWLSRKTGKPYRLLTEAEREYVTRASSTTPYWWGTAITVSQANYGAGKTAPVDDFDANPFGLYNVHGNVWEWVADCYHNSYDGAPTDGSAWTTGECTKERVLRGGSWSGVPGDLRSARRFRNFPLDRLYDAGFRVARTL
jgi:formylglycine-generating enzyme required for sulfatase activity